MGHQKAAHAAGCQRCGVCGELYEDLEALRQHECQARPAAAATARSEGASPAYTCVYCAKVFKRKFELDSHMISHTGERQYKCDSCDKAFKHKQV